MESASKVRSNGAAMLLAGIIFGAVGGYMGRPIISPEPSASTQQQGGGGGRGGGPPGMGGGGGGGGQPAPGTQVARLVRNLATIEKIQGVGLTPQQKQGLAPILKSLKDTEKLPDKDAQAKLDAIEKSLTADQKEALDSLNPGRGGGSGRGGAGGGGGGGMGGGGRPDPEKPFASERNKQALDDLITSVGGK
jgi:hypothetical protein